MGKIKEYWNEKEQEEKQGAAAATGNEKKQGIREAFSDYKGAPNTYEPAKTASTSSKKTNVTSELASGKTYADTHPTIRESGSTASSTSPMIPTNPTKQKATITSEFTSGKTYADTHPAIFRNANKTTSELAAVQERLKTLAEEMAAAEKREKAANEMFNQYNASPAAGAYAQSELYDERLKELQGAQNAVKNATSRYDFATKQEQALKQEYYDILPTAQDYAEMSTYTGNGSTLYKAINGDEAAQQELIQNGISSYHDYSWVRNIDDDVRGRYNYIYATEGEKAAEKYLDATVSQPLTGVEALGYGVMQGTGLPSVAAAVGAALGQPGNASEMLNWATQGATQSQQEHPILYGAGSTAGSVALMTAISEGLGAMGAFSSLGKIAGGAAKSAATFGTATAVQEAGAAATGVTSGEDYAADILTGAAKGAAGGALSGYKTQELINSLHSMGLENNTLARAIAAGFSGMAYSVGSMGAEIATGAFLEGNNYEFDAGASLKEMLIAGAFGTIRYLLDEATGYTIKNDGTDEAQKLAEKYFGNMTAEEAKAEYRRLVKMYHPDIAQYNGIDAEEAARIIREINTAYEWAVKNAVTTAAKATEADTTQNSAETVNAAENAISLITGVIENGIIPGTEIVDAVNILKMTIAEKPVEKTGESTMQELSIEQSPLQPAPKEPLNTDTYSVMDVAPETDTAAGENEDITQKLKANNDSIIETVSEAMGAAGKMTLNQIYTEREDIQTSDASEWAMAAKEVYETGMELPLLPFSTSAGLGHGLLDDTTAQMIYEAGQSDAQNVQAPQANSPVTAVTSSGGERDEIKRIRTQLNYMKSIEEDGRLYSVDEISDGNWKATIQNVTRVNGVPILDGQKLYNGRFSSKEEAVEELVEVAKQVFYPQIEENDLQSELQTSKLELTGKDGREAQNYEGYIPTMDGYDTEKEMLSNEKLGEVHDGERVLEPAIHGERDGGVLGGMAPEGLRENEAGGNTDGILRQKGRGIRKYAGQPDTTGDEYRHGLGRSEELRNIPTAGDGRRRNRKAEENNQPPEKAPAHDGSGSEKHAPVLAGRPVDGGRPSVQDGSRRTETVTESEKRTIEKAAAHEIETKDRKALQETPKGANYIIPQSGLKLPNGEKTRFKANIKAIETLHTLMAEGRYATPQEQEILSKYVGWGGLSNAFDERKEGWTKEYKQLKEMLSDKEYKAARGSTLNAHYTDVGVIRGIYAGLKKLGFAGGRLLEPSAGVGHFAGAMPESMLSSVKSWTMVELDEITGNIAKFLYPNADVRVQGFEAAKIPDNYMDMAISNVPFGNYGVVDKSYPKEVTSAIHNYFFAKALDKVRPGGLVTFITSRYTMDAESDAVRKYIMQRADFLGAIRLPETAFQSNAGTSVVTDILILKKRAPGAKYAGEEFLSANLHHTEIGIWEKTNDYFTEHPEMVLGTASKTGSMYHANSLTYTPKETKLSLQKQIENAFGKIKGKMEYPVQRTQEQIRQEIEEESAKGKNGGIIKKNGKLLINDNGELKELDISEKDTARMEKLIEIRDIGRTLLNAQLDNRSFNEITAARKELNRLYDDFVEKNGPLHKASNLRLIHKDADSPFILALENYDNDTKIATKAAIFTKNTVTPNVTVTHADTVEEGLIVTMNETGKIDVERIAELTGESSEAVRRELLDTELAYLNRNGELETAEQYLSGNVKAKLRDAEALAEGNKAYKRNVEALKKVIPADVAPEDIRVQPGVTWIPPETYADFAADMLGGSNRGYKRDVTITYNSHTSEYTVKLNNSWLKARAENTNTWGTSDRSFINIFSATLNNKSITVWRKTEDGKRFIDKTATAAVQEKQEKILAEFQKWMWQDANRKTELAKLYNDIFNNTVTPNYDGSNLTVNGANPDKPMRPHQKNFVQRAISGTGSTLNAYCVGAGKTYALAATAMKMRQLGIAKKPLIIVPKSLVSQWGKEFYDYFPAANIRVVGKDDFAAANRKTFVNGIAMGDYDAIIMSYQQFKAIPMSTASQEAFYQEQIDELELAIRTAAAENGRQDPSIKQLEKSKKALETKLRKIGDMKKDEDNIDFESLGVDALFVDEAHNFKNLFYSTKMSNISGLGNKEGSQQAFDLYMKTRYLQKLNGGRGVVFATATPVMNSMSEMYIMQKYLQSDLLEAKGLTSFDAWVNQFGEVRTVLEMNPSGKGYRQKQSLSKYKNPPELQQMFRSFADVLTVDKLTEMVPSIKIPKMKTGKRIIVECEPSEFQMQYIDQLAERADAIKRGKVNPREDNMLKITSEGRKLSYTQRMIDPALPYEEGNKISKCAANVYRIWNESKDSKGTQIIFCDLSTPKGGSPAANEEGVQAETEVNSEDISIYDDIRNMLIGQGIPAKDIEFIHDADTDEKKTKLFENMNEGKVRILIGSTGKMGVGMNAQRRVVALHHLDAPWRPGDIEQREGRALRQGNMNDEVGIYVYVTKKTFDSRMWDNLERKASFIHQIMAGDLTARECEGDGDFALSAAEIKAISSGNPLIMEQFEVAADLAKLESLERAHNKEVAEAKVRSTRAKAQLISDTEQAKKLREDLHARQDTSGSKFTITISGKNLNERKAAGEAIITLAKKHLNISRDKEQAISIGNFAGFKLYVTNGGDILLRGAAQYRAEINMQSALGTIQSLEALPRKIDTLLATTEKRIEENKNAVIKLEETASAPFTRAEELARTRKRNAEIMAELNPDESGNAAALDDEEIDTDEAKAVSEMIETKNSAQESKGDLNSHPERWTAKRAAGVAAQPKTVMELMEQIRHDFNINITKGHIRKSGVRGQYDKRNNGIRIKLHNDLPTAAHELGHSLDAKYAIEKKLTADIKKEIINNLSDEVKESYKEDELAGEAIAEFVREYLLDHTEAEYKYPKFTGFFLNSLDKFDVMYFTQLADDMNAYFALDADTSVSSIRSLSEPLPDFRTKNEKIRDFKDFLYQKLVDDIHGIKIFDRETGANTYKLASNAAYSDAMAAQLLVGDLTDNNGQYVAPGLRAALATIDLANNEEYDFFNEYLICKHGPERLKEGMRVYADDRKNRAEFMDKRVTELEKQYPGFPVAAERLYNFQRQFLQTWLVNMNLVSQESADKWGERWKYYVPLNRKMDKGRRSSGGGNNFANQRSPIHKAYGSARDPIKPVENIIKNIATTVNIAVKNNVFIKITDAADKLMADALFLEKVPMPVKQKTFDMSGVKAELKNAVTDSKLADDDKETIEGIIDNLEDVLTQYGRGTAKGNVLTVLKSGKPEYWKVNDSLLFESLTRLSSKKIDSLLGAYETISRFMTSNLTGRNVLWSIFSNAPRDLGTLFTYSKDKNVAELLKEVGNGYINNIKGDKADPYYKEFLAMGGSSMGASGADKNVADRARKKLINARKKNKIGWNPIDWLDYIGDMVETGPRYATYKLMRTKYGMEPQEAFYAAADITTNFRRGGVWSRELNKIIPFWNAGVQGMDKRERYFTGEDAPSSDRKKTIRDRVMIYALVSAMQAILNYALNNKSEEDAENYKQLSTYVKNNYFAIPLGDGKYFTIPKPRDLGVLTSLIEAVMERVLAGDEHAFDDFVEYAEGTMLPNFIADIITSAKNKDFQFVGDLGVIGIFYYLGANKDFLGRTIVSTALQSLPDKQQFDATTSKTAYWIGQAFNTSPKQVDFFFNNFLGGWWKINKALFPIGEENVDYTLGIQGNYIKDNLYSTDLVNWLYDYEEEREKEKNGYPDNTESAIAYKQASNMTGFYGNYYKLSKELKETEQVRATRQVVLDMIKEYQRNVEHGLVSEIESKVYDLCEEQGDVSVLPSVMNTVIKDANGKSYQLTAEQYVKFQTEYLGIYWDTIEKAFSMKDANNDDIRWEIVNSVKQYASEEAKAKTLKRIGAGTTSYGEKHEDINLEDWTMYKALVQFIDDNDSISQSEAEEALWQMMINDGLTEEEAARIFSAQNSNWKSNPFG